MIMTIREATVEDIPFVVEAIIAAEKSGSEVCGLCRLFELAEPEMRSYLAEMLDEEIEGCEFSVSSFLIAESDGEPVAAFGGWVEGVNEDELPSSILKANLMQYYIPAEHIQLMAQKSEAIGALQIEREPNTYQLEYAYVRPECRGVGALQRLIQAHESRAVGCDKMCVQVFGNNEPAIRAYRKAGFEVVTTCQSAHPETKNYLPDTIKLLMQKELSHGKK